jgi:hypothetical protein
MENKENRRKQKKNTLDKKTVQPDASLWKKGIQQTCPV